MSDKLQHRKKTAFLAAYSECGIVSQAAKIADVNRCTHYRWLDDDDYRAEFERAHSDACDALEAEARRRAIEGWDEPVFYEGSECGYKRKFSDTLLIFLMKGNNPSKYADRVQATQTIEQKVKFEGETRISIQQLQNDPRFIEYLRHTAVAEDCDSGAVCAGSKQGDAQPMENGQAPGAPGPGANGHRNGSQ